MEPVSGCLACSLDFGEVEFPLCLTLLRPHSSEAAPLSRRNPQAPCWESVGPEVLDFLVAEFLTWEVSLDQM